MAARGDRVTVSAARITVVIPSNRQIRLDYLSPLIDAGARFIVVDDSEGSISVDHPRFEVLHWGDRRKVLGELEAGIPKRNGASRDYGFYLAWKECGAEDLIIALDDDCEVYSEGFHKQIESVLTRRERPVASQAGRHLNILDLYKGTAGDLFPRGFPYSARADHAPCELVPGEALEPRFNLGLWKGGFDVNAIDKLRGPEWTYPEAELKHESVVVAPGCLVSVCSMNMHFRRDVIPAVYQLPMHVPVMPGWPVDRYGDIWGGFILKALMDLRGDPMSVGEPMILHHWAGDVKRNIWQEHVAHLLTDEFVSLLQAGVERIEPDAYLEMCEALREQFLKGRDACSSLLRVYLDALLPAWGLWLRALRAARPS